MAGNANPVRSEHSQRNNLSSKSAHSLLDASNGAKPVIMVVDDDPGIGKMLTALLGKRNYEVNYFTSGEKALAHLKNNSTPQLKDCHPELGSERCHPEFISGSRKEMPKQVRHDSFGVQHDTVINLLLTDLQMPEMTGIELAQQVKALFPALPIIVMSGSADGPARDEIFALGADFIPKPFELADLLVRINSRIKQSSMAIKCYPGFDEERR